jgi:hypothetical protein
MEKFKFYIPEDENIPTELRAANDKYFVYYSRVYGEFAYRFTGFKRGAIKNNMTENDHNEIKEAVRTIVRQMEFQSYDHGAEWRMTDFIVEDYYEDIFKVKFRIRDGG